MRSGILVTAAAGVALVACGQTPAATSRPADPKQAVLAAVQRTTATSFLADMTETETIHASGAGSSDFAALDGQQITLTMHIEAASEQRARAQVTVGVLGHSVSVTAVAVGSTVYVSLDGGKTFRTEPVGTSGGQYSPTQALQYFQAMGTVRDLGSGTADGVAVENYQATVSQQTMVALLKKTLGSLQGSLGNLANAIHLTNGVLTAAIDGQDRLVQETGTFDIALNLSALGSQYAGSTASMHIAVTAHFHGYGSTVTVTPPATTTAA